jgi:hypothetical protein
MISIATGGKKTRKSDFAQAPGKPASAVFTQRSGANVFAPPLRARIRASLATGEVRIPAILANLIQRQSEFTRQQSNSKALAAELTAAVQRVESLAQAEEWSQRKLASNLGLCPRTWRRIRSLKVNPADWLPKIRSAIPRLKPQF